MDGDTPTVRRRAPAAFFGHDASATLVHHRIFARRGHARGCQKPEAPPARASEASSVSTGTGAPTAAASSVLLGQKPNVTNRKIIRQAELELEVAAPGTTQTAIERLAEQHGGYLVSAARNTEDGAAVDIQVTVIVRVPQAELMSTVMGDRDPALQPATGRVQSPARVQLAAGRRSRSAQSSSRLITRAITLKAPISIAGCVTSSL